MNMNMKIELSFIKDIFDNKSNIIISNSDLNEVGDTFVSGSFEFDLTDSFGRTWGGRVCKINETYELVEFFPKLFFSDISIDDLDTLYPEVNPDQIKNQKFDDFIEFLD